IRQMLLNVRKQGIVIGDGIRARVRARRAVTPGAVLMVRNIAAFLSTLDSHFMNAGPRLAFRLFAHRRFHGVHYFVRHLGPPVSPALWTPSQLAHRAIRVSVGPLFAHALFAGLTFEFALQLDGHDGLTVRRYKSASKRTWAPWARPTPDTGPRA